MARIRSIKPGFCTDETIAELSIPCRLHFVMLWTHCDDHGRCVDNLRLIKAALWPLDDAVTIDHIEGWMAELADAERIIRYTVDDRKYVQVVKWSKHQHPSKPQPSEIPPPPGADPGLLDDETPGQPHNPEHSRNGQGTVPERSGNAPSGSSRGVGVGGEEEGRGVRGEPTGHRTAVAPPAAAAAPPDHEAMLLAAVDLLLTRDGTTAEAQTKRNPNRWLASARRGRADDHREHAAELLEDDPTLDAGRLAELLEPDEDRIKPDRANPHVPTWEETQARQAAEAAETNLSAEERAAAVAAVKAAATKLKEHR